MISIQASIPNVITMFRIGLVAPIVWLLLASNYGAALLLMILASLSDALDGWLARRFNWRSSFGAAIDPFADKLLVGSMFVVFWIQSHIPSWLVVVVLSRDILILTGAITYRYLFGKINFSPTLVSKANTAIQVVMLIILLIELSGLGVLSDIAKSLVDPYCFLLLGLLGISSGIDYVVTWGVKAWRNIYDPS